jgi:hypothetical protein
MHASSCCRPRLNAVWWVGDMPHHLGRPAPAPGGPPSSVQLTTTYLDERIRLGKGSRGSLFVFTRGGAADEAGELVHTHG